MRKTLLAEAAYYHGKCSPYWIHVLDSWNAVHVYGTGSCPYSYIIGPYVTTPTIMEAGQASFNVSRVNTTGPPLPGGGLLGYNWIIPSTWQVIYNEDHSQITIDSVSDYSSQMVTCVVTYLDMSQDTLTSFLHFVDTTSTARKAAQNQTQADLKMYPNPVKNQLNVILPVQPANYLTFTVQDITGREVYTTTLTSKGNLVVLPNLSSGIYIVKINGEGQDYVRKITVQ